MAASVPKSERTPRRWRAPRRHRGPIASALVVLLLGSGVLALVVVWDFSETPPMGPAAHQSYWVTDAQELALPACAVAHLDWSVPSGAPVEFGYESSGPPSAPLSGCHVARPPQTDPCSACPVSLCAPGAISHGHYATSFCFQVGVRGTLALIAYSSITELVAYQVNSTNPSAAPIVVDLTYSTPLISEPFSTPGIAFLLWGAVTSVLVAVLVRCCWVRERVPRE